MGAKLSRDLREPPDEGISFAKKRPEKNRFFRARLLGGCRAGTLAASRDFCYHHIFDSCPRAFEDKPHGRRTSKPYRTWPCSGGADRQHRTGAASVASARR